MKHTLNERELIKRAVRSVLQTLTVITEATTLHPSCSCHISWLPGFLWKTVRLRLIKPPFLRFLIKTRFYKVGFLQYFQPYIPLNCINKANGIPCVCFTKDPNRGNVLPCLQLRSTCVGLYKTNMKMINTSDCPPPQTGFHLTDEWIVVLFSNR